jgi:hypothetical protein
VTDPVIRAGIYQCFEQLMVLALGNDDLSILSIVIQNAKEFMRTNEYEIWAEGLHDRVASLAKDTSSLTALRAMSILFPDVSNKILHKMFGC